MRLSQLTLYAVLAVLRRLIVSRPIKILRLVLGRRSLSLPFRPLEWVVDLLSLLFKGASGVLSQVYSEKWQFVYCMFLL